MNLAHQLPPDPVIPYLPVALNAQTMAQLLQEKVFSNLDLGVRHIEIERIKYKPGRSCLVCYRLQLIHGTSGKTDELLLCARFYRSGGSHAPYVRALCNHAPDTPIHVPLIHLQDFDCLIWVFPNDDKLKAVAVLMDPSALGREVLPELIEHHWGNRWSVSHPQAQMVHYFPEHACCTCVTFRLSHQDNEEIQHPVLYCKTYHNNQGRRTMNSMEQLWHSRLRREGQLSIPRPIAYLQRWKSLWQLEVKGVPAMERLRIEADFHHHMARVATSIAALHQTAVKNLPIAGNGRHSIAHLKRALKLIHHVRPELARPMELLASHLCRTCPGLQRRPLATLHGDLHLKNILIDEQQVHLIDLDDLMLGDPLHDLGSLIASMLHLSLLGKLDQTRVQRSIAALLKHYQSHVDWHLDANDLCWYVTASLLTERIARSIIRVKDGRIENIQALFELAGTILLGNAYPAWLPLANEASR